MDSLTTLNLYALALLQINGETINKRYKFKIIIISRHTVVCRASQEAGVPPVSILTGIY